MENLKKLLILSVPNQAFAADRYAEATFDSKLLLRLQVSKENSPLWL